MAADNVHYDVEEELEHLRGEVRALREEQERQKQKPEHANKDDQANKEEKKPDEAEKQEPPKSHFLRNVIIAAVLLVLVVAGVIWWLHARRFESTDDAQVDGHIDTVTARIAGTITAVYAEENQFVKQGEALVDLDRRDYNAAADLARSQLLLAQAQAKAEQPNVPVTEVTNRTNIASTGMDITKAEAGMAAADRSHAAALSKVREAEANNVKAQADVERYRPLADKDEIPREQFDQVVATAKASAANVAAAQESAQAAQKMADQSRAELAQAQERANQATQNAPSELAIRQANVAARAASAQGAQAQLEQATLNLSYTKILAPMTGIIAKRIAEVGQHVTPG